MQRIHIQSGGLHVVVDAPEDGRARLIHFSSEPFDEAAYSPDTYHKYYTLLELHGTG